MSAGDNPNPLCPEPENQVGGLTHVAKPRKKPPPRYMAGLLKMAEFRKAEKELTKEKIIRSERVREEKKREADPESAAAPPPPVYVTKSYLKRMKEREAALKELDK